jgi:hypothetical protein
VPRLAPCKRGRKKGRKEGRKEGKSGTSPVKALKILATPKVDGLATVDTQARVGAGILALATGVDVLKRGFGHQAFLHERLARGRRGGGSPR